MSDNIPFDIQEEIIKSLPVKSLVRFRLVSKQWKSLIGSSKFIAEYNTHQKHKHHLLVRYGQASDNDSEVKYVSIVDDDTFPQHKFSLTVPTSLNLANALDIVSSQGLLFMHCYDRHSGTMKALIWNPTIRKSVDIDVCRVDTYVAFNIRICFGFGVCPDTCDPKIVKITSYPYLIEGDTTFEVFTLSTNAWRRLSKNLPHEDILLTDNQIAIDRFMYWRAYYETIDEDHGYRRFYTRDLIVSFDMKSEEFTEIYLPGRSALAQERIVVISSIRESLVMLLTKEEAGRQVRSVWKMMEHGVSKPYFTELYTINTTHVIKHIHGFRKSGEPIVETEKNHQKDLFVYELDSKTVNYMGIYRIKVVSSVTSYFETLLLLDQ